MATLENILHGLAQAMADEVSSLTEALDREADPADNAVRWPHGEISVVSDNRDDRWNTDRTGYSTDNSGNQIGRLLDAKWDAEFQLNIWLAVPSDDYHIQSLGTTLVRGFRRYDESRDNPDPLPDGEGGTLDAVEELRIIGGGELPSEITDPPLRGYMIQVEVRYTDRIDTAKAYGEEDYVDAIDVPESGDLDSGSTAEVAIEYNL